MTYVAAEPEVFIETHYIDVAGVSHSTREMAIEANFRCDLLKVCEEQTKDYALSPEIYMDLVERLVRYHPDMIRVLLGDRDAT